MRFDTDWRVHISKIFQVKNKAESTIMLLSRKYKENNSPYWWEHFKITNFVNSFLIVLSVTISYSLENPTVKLSEHDGAYSVVSSFRPETFSYIPGSFIELQYMDFQQLQQKSLVVQLVSLAHLFFGCESRVFCLWPFRYKMMFTKI